MDGGFNLDASVVIAVPFVLEGHHLLAAHVLFKVEVLAEEGQGAGNVGLYARFGHGLSHLVAEEIHIGHGGGAEAQRFGDGQESRRLDAASVQLILRGEDVFVQPLVQLHVVGIAAHGRHGQMGVAVDEAGHQHHALAVDDLGRMLLRRLAGEVADFAVGDADKGRKQHPQILIHGHNGDVRE